MKNCPECNSDKVIRDAFTSDKGDGSQIRVAVDEQPDALILKKRSYSELDVHICGECGYVKFYAKDHRKLWGAYLNQRN